jgi:hypothetical protein
MRNAALTNCRRGRLAGLCVRAVNTSAAEAAASQAVRFGSVGVEVSQRLRSDRDDKLSS